MSRARARARFPSVWAPLALERAWRRARRGKRHRAGPADFEARREEVIAGLSTALRDEVWRPGGYRTWIIREPKPRLIAAAPFVDRVVHHAVFAALAPVLERSLITQTFACLPQRGTHRAVLAFQQGLRRHRYLARVDVRRFFLEVRHSDLLTVFDQRLDDDPLRRLVGHILASGDGLYAKPGVLRGLGLEGTYRPQPGKGLPIGNLTSQLFANVVLDGVDHFIKRDLKVPGYLRYMDDLVLFSDQHGALRRQVEAVQDWLMRERALATRCKGEVGASTRGAFTFLGYTVDRQQRRISGPTLRRMRARLAQAARDGVDPEVLEVTLRAWVRGLLF